MLIFAIVFMILALLCYSAGVWAERFAGRLRFWHLAFFWIGLIFDTSGTTLMGMISRGFEWDVHGISGVIAIMLMIFHALWGSVVLAKNDEKMLRKFHVISLFVWMMWLVPFFTGMMLHMG